MGGLAVRFDPAEAVFYTLTFLSAQFLHDVFGIEIPDYLTRLKIAYPGSDTDAFVTGLHNFYRQLRDKEGYLKWLADVRADLLQRLDEKVRSEVYRHCLKEILPLLDKAGDHTDFLAGEIMRGDPDDARVRAGLQQILGKKPVGAKGRLIQKMMDGFAALNPPNPSSDDPDWKDEYDDIMGQILAVPEALQEMGEEEREGKDTWETAEGAWSEAGRRLREKVRWQQRRVYEKENLSEDIDQHVQVNVIFGRKRGRKRSPGEAKEAGKKKEVILKGSSVLRREGDKVREAMEARNKIEDKALGSLIQQKRLEEGEKKIRKNFRRQAAKNRVLVWKLYIEEGKVWQSPQTAARLVMDLRTLQNCIADLRQMGLLPKD